MKHSQPAFSLVEVLAAVAIIGILIFLALPNVIQAKRDTEEQMVVIRADALNIAMSSFITANGRSNAGASWTAATTDAAKYLLLKPYLSYAPNTLADWQPSGYSFEFTTLEAKTTAKRGTTPIPY